MARTKTKPGPKPGSHSGPRIPRIEHGRVLIKLKKDPDLTRSLTIEKLEEIEKAIEASREKIFSSLKLIGEKQIGEAVIDLAMVTTRLARIKNGLLSELKSSIIRL